MFLFFEKKVRRNVAENYDRFRYPILISFLGLSHIICACMLILLQGIIGSKIIKDKEWRAKLDAIKKRILRESVEQQNKETQRILALLDKNLTEIKRREICEILRYERKMDGLDSSYTMLSTFTYYCQSVIFILSDFDLVYFMFYASCSLFALILDVKILYSLSLFEIIVNIIF